MIKRSIITRDLQAIDHDIARSYTRYRQTGETASLLAVDALLDRRHELVAGHLLNTLDTATVSEFGPCDTGQTA